MPTRAALLMRRVITGTATFSSQTNRDNAYSRMTTALASLSYTPFTSTLGAGVSTSGTTNIIVSIEVPDVDTGTDVAQAIYDSWTSSNRQSAGYLSVNRF